MQTSRTFFSTNRNVLISITAAVLMILFSYLAYKAWVDKSESGYITQRVLVGSLEKTVTSLGSVQPKDYVDVGAQVSGQLKKVHVKVGDIVEKGQLLAEIDPTVYAAKVAASRANLTDLRAQLVGRQAELTLYTKQYKRMRDLQKYGAVGLADLEAASSAYINAKAAVDSARAQVSKAESTLNEDIANLGYTKIYTPVNGTVVSQTVLEGQTINASQTAPTILRIANLGVMTLNAQVAEADVSHLSEGMPVYFKTLGAPSRRWMSQVRQILPTPTMINNVVLYTVLVDVDNTDGCLMTQMTAQVFFVQGQVKDLPLVPIQALQKSEDGKNTVRVVTDQGVEVRSIEVALTNRSQAAIASGLKAGEEVVVDNTIDTRVKKGVKKPPLPIPPTRV